MGSDGSFSLRNKKSGEILKEPPRSWGYADPHLKNSRTTAKSVFETEGFITLLSYLVAHPEMVGGIDKVDSVLEQWEGKEAQLMEILKREEHKTGPAGVFTRLTDTKKYTGASKKRFSKQGAGLGLEGRDVVRKGGAGEVSRVPSRNEVTQRYFHTTLLFQLASLAASLTPLFARPISPLTELREVHGQHQRQGGRRWRHGRQGFP